jgi:hypothetical protein
LVIERLTAAALNPEVKPAQQLQALALLGKVTEVAAFTERREIIRTDNPTEARDKLVQSLRLALSSGGDGADSLLAELSRRKASQDAETIDHVSQEAEPEQSGHVSRHDDASHIHSDASGGVAENAENATPLPPDPKFSGRVAQPLA